MSKYSKNRKNMEKYFIPENKGIVLEYTSPLGKYKLKVTQYKTGQGYWNYMLGEVFNNDKLIATIKRNYGEFPYAFIENHPNGHDYLLCGEDYQGQTVVELDTGIVKSYIDEKAWKKGCGFCWADIMPHMSIEDYKGEYDKTELEVEGCFWACPFEFVKYDFSNPLNLPYPEISRRNVDPEQEEDEKEDNEG